MTAAVSQKKGTKTNERPGTRASARFVRSSAYKAREVLDLIRGKSYGEASEILLFSERGIAETVQKVLDSAVANAENNDGLPAEELYVAACFADEGPTLKRWRPRARGRATRIRKRTCHITVIVARYSPEQIEAIQAREAQRGQAGKSTSAAEARRRRVSQSRERAAAAAEHDHDHDDDEETAEDAEAATDTAEDAEAAADTEADTAEEVEASDDEVAAEVEDDEATDDKPADTDEDE